MILHKIVKDVQWQNCSKIIMWKYNYNTAYCIVLHLLCVTEIWEEKKYSDGTLVSSSDHITVISIIIVTMIMMITIFMTINIIIVTLIKTIMLIMTMMTMMTMMTITVISDHDDDNSHRFWKTPSEEAAPLELHSCQDDTCR